MSSYLTKNRKFQKKKSKKIQKSRKTIISSFREKPRMREKKKIVPISSYPIRNIKFQKKRKKKFKNLKNNIMASFQARIGWEMQRKRENKKNRSNGFLPNP